MTELDICWKNCLRMWKWIAENWRSFDYVPVMKREWLDTNGFGKLDEDCFFCDYAEKFANDDDDDLCAKCPPRLIEPKFDCHDIGHRWHADPKAFYAKLVQLDKKRRGEA